MPISADVMRVSLYLSLAAMALLAIFYLRGRRLSLAAYCLWGLLAVLLPALGPFLVILLRPGQPRLAGSRQQ